MKTTERAKPRKDEASRKAKLLAAAELYLETKHGKVVVTGDVIEANDDPETQGSHTLTISFFAREK